MSTPSDGTRFAGVHSDGRFATASPVSVRFTGGGLELRSDREMGSRTWPYDQLQGSVPLRADTPDVLLSLLPEGAETLFVADPSFSGLLLARAPALSCARQRWQGLKPGLAVLAAVVAIVSGVWLLDLHPAQTIARVMPQKTRAALGGAVVTSMTKDRKVCETPASKAALGRLTERLTAAASDKPMGVRVVLLDWSLVNAFAVPGGQIILTRGLVQRAGASDEVAGVLAHELGHTLELHPEAGIIRVVGLSAALQLALAGSQGTISNIGLILTQLRYTRIAEREADAHALRMLKGAGISAKGFGDFFERLESNKPGEEAGKSASELEMILRTHPPTAERIAMVRAQPSYPATPALSADDWRALREACGPPTARPAPSAPPAAGPTAPGPTASRAPTNPTPTPPIAVRPDTEAGREIAEATNALATNPNDVAALQKRARAYTKENRHEQALGDYTKASELKSDDAALHYGRGTALQNLRRYEEALRAYDEALRLAPGHANARNNHGNTNRALKRYDAALQDFDELVRIQPDFVHAYFNRGLVYRDMSRNEEAIRDFDAALARDKGYTAAHTTRGMAHEKMGVRDKAIEDFRAALATPQKYNNGAWAHATARAHLKTLGVDVP
ncbi:MAG: tetratricopeptide repeat protein [Alphaproteobacteria bacterium]|nr:MAG: tetratricopeptide repeat protein [Alphaproteobacteria bacterium]